MQIQEGASNQMLNNWEIWHDSSNIEHTYSLLVDKNKLNYNQKTTANFSKHFTHAQYRIAVYTKFEALFQF